MFNFLHTFHPSSVLISFDSINIYYYGFFIVLGIILALLITFKLASLYNIPKDTIIDLCFWLIIGGLIGARLYHVFLEFPYYLNQPLNIFKIWNGGLAIHGGLIAGAIILWLHAKKIKRSFWLLASIIAPGLALAQAIGRWGNYFNQELFGRPTNLPWGIPINLINRPVEYINFSYFQPTFFYEFLGNFIIFLILLFFHFYTIKKRKKSENFYYLLITICYLLLYSLLRIFTESLRLDATPVIFGWRWPQIASLAIIFTSLISPLIYIKKYGSFKKSLTKN
jgi:phosphatidylglycerol:prolipoprotein diacylglycerol transferase